MYVVEKMCLSCKHYRLRDELSGLCRVNREGVGRYPIKLHEDSCAKWYDCGQQYYIRTGWIKAQKKKDTGVEKN